MQRVYSGGVKINKHEKQYYTHGIIIINFFFPDIYDEEVPLPGYNIIFISE